VQRKWFHFCLSFSSVLVVVWAALVINTLVEKGPIIFLKLAEGNQGQYDGIIYPTKLFNGIDSFENTEGVFINYTKVLDVTAGKNFNLAPRKQFCGTKAGSKFPSYFRDLLGDEYTEEAQQLRKVDYGFQACVMFFDTQMERDIDLGSRYTFEPMQK